MAKRRRFTAEFKAELELRGESSQAEVCRRHNLSEVNSQSGSTNSLKTQRLSLNRTIRFRGHCGTDCTLSSSLDG